MKNKITRLLLTIICFLALPIIVNADMGAPETYAYDVVVTNKDGTKLLDWDDKIIATIPYDTQLTIIYEYSMDGVLYGDVEYKDEYGFIKLSDTQPLDKELDYSQFSKNEHKERYYTLKDTQMYKGPSIVFGKIEDAIIPPGETLIYKYRDEVWSLVEYNGVEGWIYSYSYSDYKLYDEVDYTITNVATKDSKLMVLTDDAVLYKEVDYESEKVGTLKKDEVYTYKYYSYPYAKTTAYYIETEEASGWLLNANYHGPEVDNIAEYTEIDILVATDNLKVYNHYTDEKPIKDITIPKYTEITSIYGFTVSWDEETGTITSANQIIYEGNKYWIIEKDDEEYYESTPELLYSYSKTKLTFKKDTPIYKDAYSTDNKLDTKIPKGTELIVKYDTYDYETGELWYFVEYDGVKGWITNNYIEEEQIKEPEEEYEDEYEEEEEESAEEKENDEEDEKETLTPKQIGLICAGGAIVLALVAIVTIKLINKKKTKVVEEPKEEIKNTTEEPTATEEIKEEKNPEEKKSTKKTKKKGE